MNNNISNMAFGWIPVSDKLPEHKGYYMIKWINKHGKERIDVAYFRKSDDKKYYFKDGKRMYSRTKNSGWTGNFADKQIVSWKDVSE